MTEIFPDIDDILREEAAFAWTIAQSMAPEKAAEFLSAYTLFKHTPEQQEFLRFYFNVEMEKKQNGQSNHNFG